MLVAFFKYELLEKFLSQLEGRYNTAKPEHCALVRTSEINWMFRSYSLLLAKGWGTRWAGLWYQLSSGTNILHVSLLYTLWLRFFVSINHFWLCAAVVSHSQPLSNKLGRNTIKRKNGLKNCMFFGNWRKFKKVKTFTQYLISTFRHKL